MPFTAPFLIRTSVPAGLLTIDGKATSHCLVEVGKQLLKRIALSGAAGYGGNLSPVATFLGLVVYNLDFHGSAPSAAS